MGGRGGGSPATRANDHYQYLITRPWVQSRGLPGPGSPEDQLIRAYARVIAKTDAHSTDNVSFVRLRSSMSHMPREKFDRAVRNLVDSGIAVAAQEEDQKRLTTADERASVKIGGKERHLINIGRK